jgi:hypothetical protein
MLFILKFYVNNSNNLILIFYFFLLIIDKTLICNINLTIVLFNFLFYNILSLMISIF